MYNIATQLYTTHTRPDNSDREMHKISVGPTSSLAMHWQAAPCMVRYTRRVSKITISISIINIRLGHVGMVSHWLMKYFSTDQRRCTHNYKLHIT